MHILNSLNEITKSRSGLRGGFFAFYAISSPRKTLESISWSLMASGHQRSGQAMENGLNLD